MMIGGLIAASSALAEGSLSAEGSPSAEASLSAEGSPSAEGSESAEGAATCDLSIKILGLESDEGRLIVALLDSAEAFDDNGEAVRDARVTIENGEALAEFGGVPFGTYAMKVFHDENANGELDTNFVGFPKESFGFSMDAMGQFGPPSFEEAKFEVTAPELTMTINMF